jgi:hypothetical protein
MHEAVQWLAFWHSRFSANGVSSRSAFRRQTMADIQGVSPEALCDLFWLLPSEDQNKFIRLFASELPVEAFFVMVAQLDRTQQKRFTDMVHAELNRRILPGMIKTAIEVARKNPEASDEEFSAAIMEAHCRELGAIEDEIRALEAEKLKAKRDRKSDPETIRKNIEICDLRLKDPKRWSLGRLASKFEVSKRAISKVLEDESKWRRLSAKLGTK